MSTTIREQIIFCCNEMNRLGINHGTSGNISAKVEDGILISPSATEYAVAKPEDVVFVPWDGKWEQGGKLPSTEWRFHLDILKARDDLGALVHTHSMYATICSIRRETIPAIHYMMAAVGGSDIRCAKYAMYGTQALADAAIVAIEQRKACLLANHGVITGEENLAKALWLAKEVEVLAQQYIFARLLGGDGPSILPDDEIERVKESIKGYGLVA